MKSMAWLVSMICSQRLLSLLALWLRLRWQAHQQQERHHYLVAIARALPEGGQIDEGHPDGTWLKLTIGRLPAREDDHG
ncbi:MAG: hypothetical protein ACRDQ4_11640 [Pseudonocardiaceae bacterium]